MAVEAKQRPRGVRAERREGSLRTALRVVSYTSILLAWIAGTHLMGGFLPGPLDTFQFVVREYEKGALLRHLGITTNRVVIAFVIAMSAGVAIGAAMGLSRRLDQLLEAWLIALLTIPRILLFVVAYLMLGLSERALGIALVLTVLPTIIVAVREGTRAVDDKLIEMARAFRRSRSTIWWRVVLPQLMPYIVGTARASLALSWKMVVLGELLGRTSGVGYQISFYFQFFNMVGILAYGITMMAILAFIDLVVMGALQRRVFRWRTPAGGLG